MTAKTNKGKSHGVRKHHSRKHRNSKMLSRKTQMRKQHKHKKTARVVKKMLLKSQRGGFDSYILSYINALNNKVNKFDIKIMLIYVLMYNPHIKQGDIKDIINALKNPTFLDMSKTSEDKRTDSTLVSKYLNLPENIELISLGIRENIRNWQNWIDFRMNSRHLEDDQKTFLPGLVALFPHNKLLVEGLKPFFNNFGVLKNEMESEFIRYIKGYDKSNPGINTTTGQLFIPAAKASSRGSREKNIVGNPFLESEEPIFDTASGVNWSPEAQIAIEQNRARRRASTVTSRPTTATLPPALPPSRRNTGTLSSGPRHSAARSGTLSAARSGTLQFPREEVPLTFEPLSNVLPAHREVSRGSRGRLDTAGVKLGRHFQSAQSEQQLPLTHYWFTHWPDHGVPKNVEEYCDFIRVIYDDIVRNGGRTLIHCSAGVGRTGVVYITLYLLFKYGIDPGEIGSGVFDNTNILAQNINPQPGLSEPAKEYSSNDLVYNAIVDARQSRMELVQGNIQFQFILNCFGIPYLGLEKHSVETPDSKRMLRDQTMKVAKEPKNKPKNRYGNILPYDQTRVPLGDQNDYINASFAPNPDPNNPGEFILAQCPFNENRQTGKVDVIPDFLNMIRQYKVRRIVMLTGLVEKGALKCEDYLKFSSGETGPLNINHDKNFTKHAKQEEGYGQKVEYTYETLNSRPDSPSDANASRA